MKWETVTLRSREQQRATVLNSVLEGRCTTETAAQLMALSTRQVRRLKQGYLRNGPRVSVHGNRGREPWHALPAATRTRIVSLAREAAYVGYNHTHLHEVLAEELGVAVSRRSVTRVLRAAGLRSPRRRRPRKHRARREPSAQAGYLLLLRESVRRRGVPLAWYSDRHSCFQRNDKEPWTLAEIEAGRRAPTQVGRALEDLGITLIPAGSPQAKGRVERCWETLQDRLAKELRRAGARTCAEANAVLDAYIARYNARFGRAPTAATSAYRPLARSVDLDGVCSLHYVRTVAHDNTVQLEERLIQIPPGPRRRSYAQCRVDLQERLNGELVVLYQGQVLARQPRQSDAPLRARKRSRGRELLADPVQPRTRPALVADAELPADLFTPIRTRHPWRTYETTRA